MSDPDPVRASYDRCAASGDFAGAFYERFFTKSPEIPAMFAHTDFVEQKKHLRASLLTLLKHSAGDPVTTRTLQHIGETHSKGRRNIRPDLYPYFVETLCETVWVHDPQCTDALLEEWTRRAQTGIDLIISLYDAPPPPAAKPHKAT